MCTALTIFIRTAGGTSSEDSQSPSACSTGTNNDLGLDDITPPFSPIYAQQTPGKLKITKAAQQGSESTPSTPSSLPDFPDCGFRDDFDAVMESLGSVDAVDISAAEPSLQIDADVVGAGCTLVDIDGGHGLGEPSTPSQPSDHQHWAESHSLQLQFTPVTLTNMPHEDLATGGTGSDWLIDQHPFSFFSRQQLLRSPSEDSLLDLFTQTPGNEVPPIPVDPDQGEVSLLSSDSTEDTSWLSNALPDAITKSEIMFVDRNAFLSESSPPLDSREPHKTTCCPYESLDVKAWPLGLLAAGLSLDKKAVSKTVMDVIALTSFYHLLKTTACSMCTLFFNHIYIIHHLWGRSKVEALNESYYGSDFSGLSSSCDDKLVFSPLSPAEFRRNPLYLHGRSCSIDVSTAAPMPPRKQPPDAACRIGQQQGSDLDFNTAEASSCEALENPSESLRREHSKTDSENRSVVRVLFPGGTEERGGAAADQPLGIHQATSDELQKAAVSSGVSRGSSQPQRQCSTEESHCEKVAVIPVGAADSSPPSHSPKKQNRAAMPCGTCERGTACEFSPPIEKNERQPLLDVKDGDQRKCTGSSLRAQPEGAPAFELDEWEIMWECISKLQEDQRQEGPPKQHCKAEGSRPAATKAGCCPACGSTDLCCRSCGAFWESHRGHAFDASALPPWPCRPSALLRTDPVSNTGIGCSFLDASARDTAGPLKRSSDTTTTVADCLNMLSDNGAPQLLDFNSVFDELLNRIGNSSGPDLPTPRALHQLLCIDDEYLAWESEQDLLFMAGLDHEAQGGVDQTEPAQQRCQAFADMLPDEGDGSMDDCVISKFLTAAEATDNGRSPTCSPSSQLACQYRCPEADLLFPDLRSLPSECHSGNALGRHPDFPADYGMLLWDQAGQQDATSRAEILPMAAWMPGWEIEHLADDSSQILNSLSQAYSMQLEKLECTKYELREYLNCLQEKGICR